MKSVFDKAAYRYQLRKNIFGIPVLFFRDLKCCFQRIRHGYCYKDLWSIDEWFLSIMPDMLQEYKDSRNGSPGSLGENYTDENGILRNDTCHNAGGKSRAENADQGLTIHTGSVDPTGKVFAAGKVSRSRKHDGCIKGGEENHRGSADPHRKNFGEIAVQHVTLEDFKENIDAAIASAMQELLIKCDIVNRKISLFDWKSTGMTSEISFGMCIPFDEEKRFYFMRIRPDGTFTFEEQRPDPFSMNDYTDCVNIFTDSDNIAGVIRYDNGDINIIRETSWFTIPEIENIQKELRSGNTSLRGAEKRSELLTSITDIKVFDEGKAKYYFVGMIGEGMRPNVNCAANLRKIEPYKNAPLRFEQLLPLMNVTFVRNGQLTVLPFPFKYLREYIQSIGG